MAATCFSRGLLIAIAVSAGLVVSPASAGTFTFNANNEGWRLAGLYDDGGLTEVPGWFGDDPALWFNAGGAHGGVILLGSGGFDFPDSPTGSQFLHWDLNSPDLSGAADWQGIGSFTYDVKGASPPGIAITGDSYVQGVIRVLKPDATISYYTDGVFHQLFGILDPIPTPWTTFSLNVAGLGVPVGSTLLNLNIRFFFEAGSPNGHDGFFELDNVTPVAGGEGEGLIPEPGTMILLGSGLVGLVRFARRRKES